MSGVNRAETEPRQSWGMSFETSAFDRAWALAATADYPAWPQIAEKLAKEGYGPVAISRLGRDRVFRLTLADTILKALKAREVAPECEPKEFSPALRPQEALRGRTR